ncbi:MAG: acetylxylan esterase [Lentisphaeria bacterium]|nr:MAG: acetylxylan esterase [Lentisphaeria bacterium]
MIRVDSQPLYDALCPEWKLAPAPEPEERLSIVPLSSPVTAPGEPITFGVSLLRHGKPVSGIGLKCRMEREFHDPVEFPLPTRSAPVEVTTDLERPGFVRLEVKFGELTAAAGGGVSPLEIAGLPDVPGFDEFWRRQLALLRSVPMTVLKMEEIAPVLPEYADRVRCFDLRVACAGAKPVSAILAMPRHAAPRSCPAYAFFHGAGVRSAFQPLTWAAHGLIALNVNAHGIENNQPPEYYQELEKGSSPTTPAVRCWKGGVAVPRYVSPGAAFARIPQEPAGVGWEESCRPRRQSGRTAGAGCNRLRSRGHRRALQRSRRMRPARRSDRARPVVARRGELSPGLPGGEPLRRALRRRLARAPFSRQSLVHGRFFRSRRRALLGLCGVQRLRRDGEGDHGFSRLRSRGRGLLGRGGGTAPGVDGGGAVTPGSIRR